MVKYTSSAYVKVYPYFKEGGFTKFSNISLHANQLTEFIWDELDQLNIYLLGFPGGSVVKNLPADAGDAVSIPQSGRPPGEGNGNTLQYSCLGNPMDRGAWQATVHGVAKELDTS